MPTPKEVTTKLTKSKLTLSVCKSALMPKGTAHPVIVETDEGMHGGIVIDRKSYYAALAALAEYEETVDHLGGKNVADVEPSPEMQRLEELKA